MTKRASNPPSKKISNQIGGLRSSFAPSKDKLYQSLLKTAISSNNPELLHLFRQDLRKNPPNRLHNLLAQLDLNSNKSNANIGLSQIALSA